MASQFIIDGYSLDVFNVKVSAVEGLDIVPKVKERTKHSWPDESGVAVDTSTDITYEAVTFSLKCRIKDSSYKDAVKRFNGLVALLSGDGYHLLGSITRGKLYPVVLDEVTGYKQLTATSANPVWIEFTLKLLCPLPECRMGSATVTASGAVSLNANTGKQVNVWWGDGTTTTGTGALNHTYTNAGTYTLLIAGTGVTKSVFTTTVITIDEYSYPASGDVHNVDVSHTSEETWNALQAHLANLSPEYTDTQITTLQSDATGGDIAAVEATWLGATAKSVLSYLQKLLSKVYAINSRVAVLENNIIADFVTTSTLTTIDVTGLNFVDGEVFTVECIGTSTVEGGNCLLALNNKKVTEYWYSGSLAFQGFIGATGGFYRNVWTVRVNTFNCFCSTDHNRSNAAGNSFVQLAVNSQTKPTTIGGLVETPITMLSITTNPNGLAAGTRIIVKKKIS